MIGFAPDGTEVGVLDQFSGTRTVQPPEPAVLYREDFESTPELGLPAGWVAQHRTTVDVNADDPNNPRSNTYLTWTVVSSNRLAQVFGANRLSVAGTVNSGSVYAESDNRGGAQIQFLITPDIPLNGATNVEVTFLSNYLQNQDSLGALEYSTDSGSTWRPALYLLDANDVVRATDGTNIDALATFTRQDPDGVPTADGSAPSGGTYGDHILCRPFEALGAFVSPRINDDAFSSKRAERIRLTQADGQAAVRFRFALVGTGSWFWGVDDFEVRGFPPTSDPLRITSLKLVPEGLRLEWTGPASPCQVQRQSTLNGGTWENVGPVTGATQKSIMLPPPTAATFYRLQLVP
jgi:hypothetical protein